MEFNTLSLILCIALVVVGAVCFFIGMTYRKKVAEKEIGSAEEEARRIINESIKGGEIIGGSQREDSLEKLEARMDELGLKKEDYDFYLDLRKYGSARHSGFGLGFERCVMYLTGVSNIRDVIPFPRTVNNCEL